MFDKHNVASSVYFSVKAITSILTSFISGTSAVIFLNVIFARTSQPRRRPFWARPLKTEQPNWLFDVCSQEAGFGCTSGSVPEETHSDTGYDWKTTTSSKGETLFLFLVVLTFRSYFCVSDVEREVSFFQRLRGKEELNGRMKRTTRTLNLILLLQALILRWY